MHTQLLDDNALICHFLEDQNLPIANQNLKIEITDTSVQLLANWEGIIAVIQRVQYTQTISLCTSSKYYELIREKLVERHFLPSPIQLGQDFEQYRRHQIPDGYEIQYTATKLLWREWRFTWHEKASNRLRREILMMFNNNWYPIQDIGFHQGLLVIRTLVTTVTLHPDERVIWLYQTHEVARPRIGSTQRETKLLSTTKQWAMPIPHQTASATTSTQRIRNRNLTSAIETAIAQKHLSSQR